MSEHISLTGEVEHWHSPQQIFAYCFRCKQEKRKLTIEINQNFMGFSITARCPKCKRAIWTGRIDCNDEQDTPLEEREMIYWHKFKDKKCCVCKKPTNSKDAVCRRVVTNSIILPVTVSVFVDPFGHGPQIEGTIRGNKYLSNFCTDFPGYIKGNQPFIPER